MSPVVLDEFLGVFVNTLTAGGKYPVEDYGNLQLSIQIQISEKQKKLFFFFAFLEFTSKVEHFERKDCVIVNVFPKLQTVKKLVRTLSKKRHFRTHFDSKNLKASQILAISP